MRTMRKPHALIHLHLLPAEPHYLYVCRNSEATYLLPLLEELVEFAINHGLAFHAGVDDEVPSVDDMFYRAQRA